MKYGPFSSDLQDYQYAGPLVCRWTLLSGLSGACVQDPRLPLVSQLVSNNLLLTLKLLFYHWSELGVQEKLLWIAGYADK